MLEAKHVTLSRGGTVLLRDASFLIGAGEKVGLVGANGAGKTTLMRTLLGAYETDAGSVARPRRTGYLGQERLADDLLVGVTAATTVRVREALLAGRDLGVIAAELRAIEAQLAQVSAGGAGGAGGAPLAVPVSSVRHVQQQSAQASVLDALLARYGALEERFRQAGGYAAEHELVQLLHGLGLGDVELERPVQALSGGQKTRLALARVLFAAPELLLLDEPTNHLDGPATRWLMDYLARFPGSVLLISHDLALLDSAITRVLHLDAAARTLTAYTGNYSSYQRQRAQAEESAAAQAERQQAKIARLEEQA